MKTTSMAKVGSVCSILAGTVFLASGGVYFLFQVGQFDYDSIQSISEYLAAVPVALTMWTILNWGAALASFLAIAGVLALSDELRPVHDGLVRWTSTLAIIGYAVLAITNIADLYQIRRMALGYAQLDHSARSALEAMGSGTLDPTLSLRYSTIGPWFLVAGWLALRASPELYRRLISKARGDHELAQRLVEYERNYLPKASQDELVRSAIERWERDNR